MSFSSGQNLFYMKFESVLNRWNSISTTGHLSTQCVDLGQMLTIVPILHAGGFTILKFGYDEEFHLPSVFTKLKKIQGSIILILESSKKNY